MFKRAITRTRPISPVMRPFASAPHLLHQRHPSTSTSTSTSRSPSSIDEPSLSRSSYPLWCCPRRHLSGSGQPMQYQYQYQVEPVNPRRQYAMAGLAVAGLIGGFLLLDWYFNRPVRAVERRQSEAAALTGGEIVPLEDMLTATATTTTMAGQTMGPIPRSVHEYMFNTYKYVAGGIGLTALSAFGFYRAGVAQRLLSVHPMLGLFGLLGLSLGTMIGTTMVDPQRPVLKHGMFTAWNVTQGLMLCTLGFFRPQVLVRAGLYTAGIFAATTFTAMNARHDAFLWLGAPLFAALTTMVIASFGRLLLPARFARTHGAIHAFVLYGGLMLFCAFLLYDTQILMKRARAYNLMSTSASMDADLLRSRRISAQQKEEISDTLNRFSPADRQRIASQHSFPPPDHINESIGIYLDLLNIFVRLVYILGSQQGGGRRRR